MTEKTADEKSLEGKKRKIDDADITGNDQKKRKIEEIKTTSGIFTVTDIAKK